MSYDYDAADELTAIRENGGVALAGFAYDDLGRRTSLTRANGVTTSYGYDAASQLTGLGLDLAGTATDQGYGFAYNPAGQIASRTASNGQYAWSAGINVSRPYTANGLNQYTASGGTALGYDGRGNLSSSGSTSYGYTVDDELAQVNGLANLLRYDPLGRLLNVNPEGGVVLTLSYDGAALTSELDQGTGALLRRYVTGPGTDEPLVWYEGSGTGDRRYLVADERGSIVAVTDGTGNALSIDAYDEYGIPSATAPAYRGRFGYTGQAWLPSLGLWYYRARMYSPTLGRFLQTDPMEYGDGLNWYDYVGGDPVNSVDPAGLEAIIRVCGGGGVGPDCRNPAVDAFYDGIAHSVFDNPAPLVDGSLLDGGIDGSAANGPLPVFIKSESCRNAPAQSGNVIASPSINGSVVAGAGPTASSGTFEVMAPNGPATFYKGSFYTVGAGLGLDSGGGVTMFGMYRNMNSFLGTGFNININIGVASGTLIFGRGGIIGGSLAVGLGLGPGSVTASGTYIYNCYSGHY